MAALSKYLSRKKGKARVSYLLLIAVTLGAIYTGSLLFDLSLPIDKAKVNGIGFALPYDSAYYMSLPEDGDRRVRILKKGDQEVWRVNPYGVILPNGDAVVPLPMKEGEDLYRVDYLLLGDGRSKPLLNLIEEFYYNRDFSLAGERETHFLKLKQTKPLTVANLRKRLSKAQNAQLVAGTFASIGKGWDYQVEIPDQGVFKPTKDKEEFDRNKKFQTILIESSNTAHFDPALVLQNGSLYAFSL